MGPQIFWIAILLFLFGIAVRTVLAIGWVSILFFAALSIVPLLFILFERSRERALVLSLVAALAFAGGMARMHGGIILSDPLLDAHVGEKVRVTGFVQDEPDVRENNVRISLRITSVASTSVSSDVAVLVIAPLHTEVSYGDYLSAEGKLDVPTTFETGEGRYFDYPGFLVKDRILYSMSFARVEREGRNEGNKIKAWAIAVKKNYLEGLANALSEPQAGLAGGITVGDKRGLGEALSETFRTVGLTHIVVLSGYNIMVVVEALMRALSRAPQTLRFSLAVFVAFFFAAITGFASASSRAALMASIAILGKASGRTYLASRALALVAGGMVLWNPYILLFDPGFQLSIIATAGLIHFSPLFESGLTFLTQRFGLRDIAAATLGTQLAVLPLLLYQNGQLSVFALPANLFALVVIPFAMLFSALAAFFGLFTGVIAPLFGFPAYILLSYVISVAELFAWLPFSALSIPAFGFWWLILIYSIIFWIAYRFRNKKSGGTMVPPHS